MSHQILRLPSLHFVLISLAIVGLVMSSSDYVEAQKSPTVTVTKTEDTDDGICDDDCSLREALDTALPGTVIIVPAGIYTLSLGSQLEIRTSLTLEGAGAAKTIIQPTEDPTDSAFRAFTVDTPGNVVISGMTVRHGTGGVAIGAQYSEGEGGSYGGGGDGGGINVKGGVNLTLLDMVITENSTHNRGGAIAVVMGSLILSGTTVSNNVAVYGGGIFAGRGNTTVNNSTISGNTAEATGGGIQVEGILHLINSTVSGNTAGLDGGGVNNAGTTTVTNSTLFGNGAFEGGGMFNDLLFRSTLTNTIIAHSSSGNDCFGRIGSLGHNLDSDGTCEFSEPGDISGVDPFLSPLQDNGGPTLTHSPLIGSPTVDAGDDVTASPRDQRGTTRPEGVTTDIGSVELGAFPSLSPVPKGDSYVIDPGKVLVVDRVSGVLANDTNPLGTPLKALLVEDVSGGTLSLNPDGSFRYQPDPDSVSDTFAYRASAGTFESDASVVMITTIVEEELIGVIATPEPLTGHGCIATSGTPASVGLTNMLFLFGPVGVAAGFRRSLRRRKRR